MRSKLFVVGVWLDFDDLIRLEVSRAFLELALVVIIGISEVSTIQRVLGFILKNLMPIVVKICFQPLVEYLFLGGVSVLAS